MTVDEVRSLLKRTTYKEGTKLHFLHDESSASFVLRTSIIVQDATSPQVSTIPITTAKYYTYEYLGIMGEKDFKREIFGMLKQLELHELDEFLKFDGEHYQAPHPAK